MNTCESYQRKVTMELAQSEVFKLSKADKCYMNRKNRTDILKVNLIMADAGTDCGECSVDYV